MSNQNLNQIVSPDFYHVSVFCSSHELSVCKTWSEGTRK